MINTDPKVARLARQSLSARDRYLEAEKQRQAVAFALPMGRYDALSSHPEVVTKAASAYRAWVACEKAYARYVDRLKR
jgi:hypothetical protein